MSDFWARKLGTQQPRGIVVGPPQQVPQQQQVVHVPAQGGFPQQYQQVQTVPQQQMVPEQVGYGSREQLVTMSNDGNFVEAMGRAVLGGLAKGPAAKALGDASCPSCGSVLLGFAAPGSKIIRCFSCGQRSDGIRTSDAS